MHKDTSVFTFSFNLNLTLKDINVLLEMMMSVLQEVKGLTKKLYFVILLVRRPVTMQNFRLNVYTVYLF